MDKSVIVALAKGRSGGRGGSSGGIDDVELGCPGSHQGVLCFRNHLGNYSPCSAHLHRHSAPTSFSLVSSWYLPTSHICHARLRCVVYAECRRHPRHRPRHHHHTATELYNCFFRCGKWCVSTRSGSVPSPFARKCVARDER